jgi:hypothetical protein
MKEQIYPSDGIPEKRKRITYEPTEDGKIEYQRKERIILPMESSETKISVRLKDLERLKRCLGKNENQKINLSIVYSILYGISGSSGLSLIPFMFAATPSPWVIPLYICICIFSLIAALGINLIDTKMLKRKDENNNDSIKEIDDIITACIDS